ncbi:MAG TPA: hypothetical protein VIT43_07730 [Candidatus Dormibacteraeota bacterium]
MRRQQSLRFRVSWIALLVTGLATLVFGLVVVFLRGSDKQYFRAIGAASIGMGPFGSVITVTAFRRRERWAYFSLWYYPIFWMAHLVSNLPPGKDHVHQVVFIVLSLFGLLLPIRDFFPRRVGRLAHRSESPSYVAVEKFESQQERGHPDQYGAGQLLGALAKPFADP